jgi:16S rRNA (adenine1518-N6/adenine1519-N6)-dimethyltransferase
MNTSHVQTKREIQTLLAAAGRRPNKRYGQHFLIDGNLMRKLVDEAQISPGDTVLEVGGGTGGLTDLLAQVARHVVVVEVDGALASVLADRFAGCEQVTLLECDALTGKHTIAPAVLEALKRHAPPAGGEYLLVANLPYSIASPLIVNLLVAEPRVERLCFTVQKEVAQRLMARAGSKDFGPLSIAAQTVCAVRRVAWLPASAFWPAPQVESAMLRLDRQEHPFEQGEALRRFFDLVHAGFAHRRKTLRFNLQRHLTDKALAQAAEIVDLAQRAEAVELGAWIELGRRLCAS